MTSHIKHNFPTLILTVIAIAGVLAVLWAWQLPPFNHHVARTENAYVQGTVTTISPQVAGLVVDVPVNDFATVKKGDVLVRLDDRSAKLALAQAQATLDSANASYQNNQQSIRSAEASLAAGQATLQSAQAAEATAETEWHRAQALSAKGIMSTSDADDDELTYRQAVASVAEAQAQLKVSQEAVNTAKVNTASVMATISSAKASVASARLDLEHTVIRAPSDGRLGQISVRVGQYVTAGTSLMSHVGTNIYVVANFKETQLAGMQIGQKVEIQVDALNGETFDGHIQLFSPATAAQFSVLGSSTATGNFTKIAQRLPVRIAIDADQAELARLAPGMSVEVTVRRGAELAPAPIDGSAAPLPPATAPLVLPDVAAQDQPAAPVPAALPEDAPAAAPLAADVPAEPLSNVTGKTGTE